MILSIVTLCLLYIGADGQESPKVVPFTSLVKTVIGSKTSFTCQSLTGSSPLEIIWFKDGKKLFDSPTIKIRTNEDGSMLIITSISSMHSGNYTCSISNPYGQDSFTTELLVEGAPNWIEKPQDTKIQLHETLKLQCSSSGYPKPKVIWKKFKDSSWTNFSSDYLSGSNLKQFDDELIITNVSRDLNGRYGCSVSNGIEPDLWSEFNVVIEGINISQR
ncbi:cell adhesion molecule Dscam2-like isoform X2 [Panonychus citri]|uniref:cell adhesion molecule Dscam2-like isoform X2 n=1 Tax=Panonychus citri TaxID=50023 RepID=UPI0023076EA2|nr:cell adhesion molecule Dscam2-like isoform X2 [Panonychus citri]